MKHLWCRTIASATKKMCLGSADVPGPPEQNNDIITISVTDQTVHKVTGEQRGCNTHTGRTRRGPWRLCPEAWDAGRTTCLPLSSCISHPKVRLVPHHWWLCFIQSQLLLKRPQKSEKLTRDSDWLEKAGKREGRGETEGKSFESNSL